MEFNIEGSNPEKSLILNDFVCPLGGIFVSNEYSGFKDGVIDQKIADKIAANATLSVLDQYIFSLKKLSAIALDAGEQDFGISGTTRELHERLENYDIDHFYESYQGDHLNKIAERIYQKVLPYFSKNLKTAD